MNLFLYGTLADPTVLGKCAGKPVRGAPLPARLTGFRRVLLRGAPFPTLRRAPGAAVHGVMVRVSADMLVRLTPGANEAHVGVIMSVLGGPFFLALLISLRRSLA